MNNKGTSKENSGGGITKVGKRRELSTRGFAEGNQWGGKEEGLICMGKRGVVHVRGTDSRGEKSGKGGKRKPKTNQRSKRYRKEHDPD